MIKDIIIHIVGANAPKGTFRPYQLSEPQPRGAVTRRVVAQRSSRASGLTCPLAEAIWVFDFGFLCRIRLPAAPRFAVSLFFFSYLPIRKGLILLFAGGVSPPFLVFSLLFSASYPQARRSYYLICITCSLTT